MVTNSNSTQYINLCLVVSGSGWLWNISVYMFIAWISVQHYSRLAGFTRNHDTLDCLDIISAYEARHWSTDGGINKRGSIDDDNIKCKSFQRKCMKFKWNFTEMWSFGLFQWKLVWIDVFAGERNQFAVWRTSVNQFLDQYFGEECKNMYRVFSHVKLCPYWYDEFPVFLFSRVWCCTLCQ